MEGLALRETGPLHFKYEGGKRGRAPTLLFTIAIYDAVMDAGEEGLTVPEIHDRFKDDPAFQTDTAQWWEKLRTRRGSVLTFDVHRAGRERIHQRVQDMRARDELISDSGTGRGRRARYKANLDKPPRNYVPKWRRQNPHGWLPIDVKSAAREAALHRDRIAWLTKARRQLALQKPKQFRELVEEAVRLLEQQR